MKMCVAFFFCPQWVSLHQKKPIILVNIYLDRLFFEEPSVVVFIFLTTRNNACAMLSGETIKPQTA